jgi:zinc/manganese transport system ATP-binding protein
VAFGLVVFMKRTLFPEKKHPHKKAYYKKHSAAEDLVRIEKLAVHYQTHLAIEGITGAFKKGSLTAIVGPNGGGKSTLLKAIMGLVPSSHGHISLSETLTTTLAYLAQQSEIDRTFPLTVQDVVASGHCQHEGFFKRFDKNLQEKVDQILTEVGLQDCLNRSLHTLSGGQFQRVLFARIALQDSDCILLDEPFTAVDSYTIQDLIKIIVGWHTQGKTLLVVNHDLDLIQEHFPEALLIARHVLAWGPTATVLTAANLKQAQTIARDLEKERPSAGRNRA